ncbi:MAG: PilN domain-containing protein [Rhodocyclaceae bacterium]|jgi:type IV pilus assembly protein PilN|nr:PilN domain-containing protein [Rhodocyclaceae bacterium]
MIRINLLPHREERRKALRQQFYAFAGLVVVAAGAIWFLGYTLIDAMIEHQAEKNRFLKSEIAVLDKQIEEIKKLKEQTEALLQRKQVIESLQVNRSETVYLFNELARQLPTGVYLKSIKQEGQKITLTGYAQSNARVSTLMRNLDDSPLLERPALIEIKAVQVGKRRLNEFAMNIFFTRQSTAQDGGEGAKKAGVGK